MWTRLLLGAALLIGPAPGHCGVGRVRLVPGVNGDLRDIYKAQLRASGS